MRKLIGMVLMLLVASLVAWGATAQESTPDPAVQRQTAVNLYWQSCGTCHTALPPEVLPLQTWQTLLRDPNHYGQMITPPSGPILQLIWSAVRESSLPINDSEKIPYRLADSRFFRALHPEVTFRDPVRVTSCIDCHPQADIGNFINLTPEWLAQRDP